MAFPGESIELGLSGYDELGEPTAVVFRLTDNSVTTLGMGPPVRMEVSIGLEIEAEEGGSVMYVQSLSTVLASATPVHTLSYSLLPFLPTVRTLSSPSPCTTHQHNTHT